MHFYGHTLSDIPKRTRNTKQDAVRCILCLFVTINLNIRKRERERERCLTCKNNVEISHWTFFSRYKQPSKLSFHFCFLRAMYSMTNILVCHRILPRDRILYTYIEIKNMRITCRIISHFFPFDAYINKISSTINIKRIQLN